MKSWSDGSSRGGPSDVVGLALTHRCNAVRGHRTGSSNSGAENYLRRETNKKQKVIHTITETNPIAQTKNERLSRVLPGEFSLYSRTRVRAVFPTVNHS